MSDSSYLTSQGIRIHVDPVYMPKESSPKHHYYVFAYRVEIENIGTDPVQLINREWRIVDALGKRRTVRGPGVVGQQPVLQPGESFSYASRCDFPTETGYMYGFYTMLRLHDRSRFPAQIPGFVMSTPWALN